MAVEVWWAPLTAADARLLDTLDATERARVRSLERPADQGRSLLGAALLRHAAGAALAVAPSDVLVDRTCAECGAQHGAPRLVGPRGSQQLPSVSVSHAGLLVVVAVGDGPLGVDVERAAAPWAAGTWVASEALAKARSGSPGPEPGAADDDAGAPDVVVTPLEPPLPGYAAALAAPRGIEVLVRSWEGAPPPRCPEPCPER